MKFSVIIPTYNRSMQLMLTLTAFEKQTYPMDHFEVIVVNDGSKDDTMQRLQQYQAPYRLVILSLSETTGRSVARNIGVAAAREEFIIFCDPDFLVSPQFIQVHSMYHSNSPNTIVSGVPNSFKNVFTHLHSDFSDQEKAVMSEILKQSGLWSDHFRESTETIEIVTQEDIRNQNGQLEKVIQPGDVINPTTMQFQKTDVAPWLLAVTRCLSVPRKLFKQVGGFYEEFQKHGLEDWELGYRLHRRGYKYVSIKETIGYHQEHPSVSRFEDTSQENLRIMFKHHGFLDPELSLFAVCSPSVDMQVYKNTLRILKSWRNSKRASYRTMARRVRRTCTRSAKLFYEQPESQAYQKMATALKQALVASNELYTQKQTLHKHRKIKEIMGRTCRSLRNVRG